LHRAFSVFVFNASGELLLQQRASSKKTWPGVWSNSCCGHVMLHESVERAAARRLIHELGISGTKLLMALPDFRYRAEKDGVVENEICPVLVGFTDSEPLPNPTEVGDHKWVNWNAFVAEIKSGGSGYSPWAAEEVERLAESEIFNRYFRENVSHLSHGPRRTAAEAVSYDQESKRLFTSPRSPRSRSTTEERRGV